MQDAKDRDKWMQEMKRELKRLQVRLQLAAPLDSASSDRYWRLMLHAQDAEARLAYRLQRLRDQIRQWAADPTIRDTELLMDARHAIEHEMVRFAILATMSWDGKKKCVGTTNQNCLPTYLQPQEHFKECEKEAKLKPFAKAALAAGYTEKVDPTLEAKAEAQRWLKTAVSGLAEQVEQLEVHICPLQSAT